MEKTQIKILLVEDNPADVVLLRQALEGDALAFFELKEAVRLSSALALLQQESFDIILLDLGLPDSQGLDTFIRIHQEAPETPTIILSGFADEDFALQSVQLGAQDYLVKSYDVFSSTARAVRYAIQRHRLSRSLRASEARYHQALDSMMEGCQIIGYDWRYLYVNDAAARQGHRPAHELLGHTMMEMYPGIENTTLFEALRTCMETRIVRRFENQFMYPDGSSGWFELSIQPSEQGLFILSTEISERKQAEEQLRAEQLRFAQVAATIPGAICTFKLSADGSFSVPYASEAFEDLFGLTLADVAQNVDAILEKIPPEQVTPLLEAVSKSAATLTPWRNEFRYRHPRKGDIWLEGYSMPVRESDGSTIWHGVTTDITERKQSEQALKESEEFLKVSQGIANMGSWELDLTNYKARWSENCFILYGFEPNEIEPTYELFKSMVHTDDLYLVQKSFEEILGDKKNHASEMRIVTKDGAVKWVHSSIMPVVEGDNVIKLIGIQIDISERKRAEEALAHERNLLRTIIDLLPDRIYVKDTECRFLLKNRADALSIGAASPDEMVGKSDADYYPPEMVARFYADDQTVIQSGQPLINREETVMDADNTLRWILTSKVPWRNSEGRVMGLVGIGHDITERKQAEEKIRESEERFSIIFQASPAGIILTHIEDGHILNVNDTFLNIFGYEREEVIGNTTLALNFYPNPEERSRLISMLQNQGKISGEEAEFRRSSGEIGTVYLSAEVIDLPGGKAILSIMADITERKRAEEQVRAAQAFAQDTIDALSAHICVIDENGMIISVNRAWQDFADANPPVPAGYFIGENYLTVCDNARGPDSEEAAMAAQGIRAVMNGEAGHFQLEYPCPSTQEKRWFTLKVTRFFQNGSARIVVAHENITERKQAEEDLKRSEYILRLFVEHSPAAIAMFDNDMRYIVTSQRYRSDYRLPEQDLTGHSHYEVFPEISEHVKEIHRRCLNGAIERADEDPFPRVDGTLDWVRWEIHPWYEKKEKIGGIILFSEVITERKQAEMQKREALEELRKEQKLIRVLIDNLPDLIFMKDRQSRFLVANKRTAAFMGVFTSEQLIGRTDFDFYPQELAAQYYESEQQIIKSGNNIIGWERSQFDAENNNKYWLSSTKIALHDEQGQIFGLVGIERDITEWKQAEEKLRESEEQYRYLFENNPHPMWAYDLKTLKFLAVNDSAVEKYGYSRAEFLGMTIADIRPAEDVEPLKENVAQPRPSLQHSGQWRHRLKDGTVIDVEISSHTLNLSGYEAALVVALDITERKQAEEELHQSNERFTEIANNIADIFWVSEPHTRKNLYINPAFQTIVGRSIETVSQLPNGTLDVLLPEDRHILVEAREREDIGMKTDVQYRIQRPDGSIRWIRDRGTPVFDENGKVVRVVGIARDLTEQIDAEIKLRESEFRLRQMAENIQEAFWMFDRVAHKHVYANHAYEVLFKANEETLNGDPDLFTKRVIVEDLPAVRSVLEKQELGEYTEIEYRIHHADGEIRWVWDRSFPVHDEKGKLVRTAGVITDITERRLAAEEMRQRVVELEMLYASGLVLNQLSSVRKIGEKIIELLDQKMDWHHSTIRLYDPETQSLKLVAFSLPSVKNEKERREAEERISRSISQPGEGFTGWAMKNNQVVRSGNISEDPRYRETYPGMRSGLYVPMKLGQNAIGVISVESEQMDAFSESDERLVTTLSSQAAVAIENALLNSNLERRVNERTAEVQDLYDNAPTGYHSLDANGCFRQINQTELNWLGYTHEEMIGRSFGAIASPEDLNLFETSFSEFKKSGRVRDLEFRLVRKDGTTFPVLVNATAIFDEQGRYVMSRSTMFDNTERKKTEEALQTSEAQLRQSRDELSLANAALERASRMKDEFLASMSHELRTPLTGILGLSEALQLKTYGELNEKQCKTLKTIEESGRHLLELINDILDLSKIEAGKLELQFAPCSIGDVCQASLQLTKGMAHKKRQVVHYSPLKEPIIVRADARRLKQILVNLLSNAVKFTPENGELGLEVQADDAGRNIKLTVWDKGIGIKPENMQMLFDPFTQIDSSLAREYSGTGLGLSLVDRLVRLHNGGVEVNSAFGEGSRFTVTLPWSPRDTTPIPYTPQRAAVKGTGALNFNRGSNSPKIFAVDDNEVVLQMISDYLEAKGYRVSKARNSLEFFEHVREVRPHLIIMDIQMPGMDGLETIRHVRNYKDTVIASVPIIAVTALAMTGDRERCLDAGANEYMSKPVKLKELAAIIKNLIENKS